MERLSVSNNCRTCMFSFLLPHFILISFLQPSRFQLFSSPEMIEDQTEVSYICFLFLGPNFNSYSLLHRSFVVIFDTVTPDSDDDHYARLTTTTMSTPEFRVVYHETTVRYVVFFHKCHRPLTAHMFFADLNHIPPRHTLRDHVTTFLAHSQRLCTDHVHIVQRQGMLLPGVLCCSLFISQTHVAFTNKDVAKARRQTLPTGKQLLLINFLPERFQTLVEARHSCIDQQRCGLAGA
jgi:hypothetical protein